jgi:predicted permease
MIGDALWRDVRHAVRVARLNAGFSAMVALTIAVGIGSTLTTFSAVDRLLLRGPELVDQPERVARIYITTRAPGRPERTSSTVGYAAYTALRDNVRAFDAVAAYGTSRAVVGRGIGATSAMGGAATAGFFTLLGVRPTLGRVFSPDEDRPEGAAQVALLDYDFWQRQFGGEQAAVGRALIVNDVAFTIIGILPRGFTGAALSAVDFWIPMSAWQKPTADWTTTWRAQWLTLVVRLAPGSSADAAGRRATTAFREAYSGPSKALQSAELSLRPLTFTSNGAEPRDARVVRWLAVVALFVLAIACSNVVNLMLARALDRRREVALRLTLGSTAFAVTRLLAVEALVLVAVGGVGGVAVASLGVIAVRRVFFSSIAWPGPLFSFRMLAGAALLTCVVGLIVALAPAIETRRLVLAAAIRGGARDGGMRRSRLRDLLVVTQTALMVPLLVGAGLFLQSLRAIHSLDLGVTPDRVLVGEIAWGGLSAFAADARDAERARRAAVYADLAREFAARGDVEHASLAVGLPFGYSFGQAVRVPGADSTPALPGGGPFVSAVTSDYFATAGTPIVRGRAFRESENANSERVAIVNETAAQTLWPSADPLDKCVLVGDKGAVCARVVGVARDAHQASLQEAASLQIYLPFGQEQGFGGTALLVRPRGDARRFAPTLTRRLVSAAPEAVYPRTRLLQDEIDPQIRPWRAGAGLFTAFGGIAFAVAMVGLYSVLAYTVAQRLREFAIRIALGAPVADVVRSALVRGFGAVAAGLLVGMIIAMAASRLLQPMLFETSALSPMVYAAVAIGVAAVVVVASLRPALRALRADALLLLRAE